MVVRGSGVASLVRGKGKRGFPLQHNSDIKETKHKSDFCIFRVIGVAKTIVARALP